jgi:hypothetical protein
MASRKTLITKNQETRESIRQRLSNKRKGLKPVKRAAVYGSKNTRIVLTKAYLNRAYPSAEVSSFICLPKQEYTEAKGKKESDYQHISA